MRKIKYYCNFFCFKLNRIKLPKPTHTQGKTEVKQKKSYRKRQ